MEVWSFELLGGVKIHSGSRSLSDLIGTKVGALLTLLALAPGRMRPREEVIDLLWPEVNFDEGRVRFRQILARLRRQLEAAGADPDSVLVVERSQIGIAAGHTSDVARFLQALRSAAVAPQPDQKARHLRDALSLYQGEFAPGFYMDALLTERQRLATLAEGAQEKLRVLEADDAFAPTPTAAPHTPLLPPFVSAKDRFFGREREQEQLEKLTQKDRLVTILGPGGMGKTRLSQQIAKNQNAPFVSLATLRNGASIPDTVVASLRLPPSSDTALSRLKAEYERKETLLVLDNIEQLLESGGAEAISSILESVPGFRLLTTSRFRLNLPQECVYPLGSLPEEDAIALFVDRAHLTRFDFSLNEENRRSIAELCRRLDGLPLAIELASSRVAVLSVDQILERLSRRFDLLTDRRKDREERQRSLRAAMDWGWGLLSPEVQHFFTQLCVFQGSFSLEAVEAITGEFLAIDSLQNLIDASFILVELGNGRDEQRFCLLETLREYGLERLEHWEKEEKENLWNRYGEFYFEKSTLLYNKLYGETLSPAMDSFEKDIANFVFVINYFLKSNIVISVKICLNINKFWYYSYLPEEGIKHLENTLEEYLKIENPDVYLLAGLYNSLGTDYNQANMFEKSHKYICIALQYYRNHLAQGEIGGMPELERVNCIRYLAGSLHNATMSDWVSVEEKEKFLLEAAMLNRQINNHAWLSLNLQALSYICEKRAILLNNSKEINLLLQKGLHYVEESVCESRKSRENNIICDNLCHLSGILFNLNRIDSGLEKLKEGYSIASSLDERRLIGCILQYHNLSLLENKWEIATRFLGAIEGFEGRRNHVYSYFRASYLYNSMQPRRDALPHVLGQERYDALYQEGFHANIDTIKQWVATMHPE